jgi:hypothetical protein
MNQFVWLCQNVDRLEDRVLVLGKVRNCSLMALGLPVPPSNRYWISLVANRVACSSAWLFAFPETSAQNSTVTLRYPVNISTTWCTHSFLKFNIGFCLCFVSSRDTRWRSWLKHCATSRGVAGSFPDVVIGTVHGLNPSGHTMALGSTQSLTEISTRNVLWEVKAAGA